jgi:hypothetical protein
MNKIRKTAKQNKLGESASQTTSLGAQPPSQQAAMPKRSTRDKTLPQIPRARPAGNTLRSFDRSQTSRTEKNDQETQKQSSSRSSRRPSVEVDKDINAPSNLKESGSIPLLIEGTPERPTSADKLTSGDRRPSVRERRNLHEMEVTVPKTVEQLEQAVQASLAARAPSAANSPFSAFPPRRASDQRDPSPEASRESRSSSSLNKRNGPGTPLLATPSHLDQSTAPVTPRDMPPIPARSSERHTTAADVKRNQGLAGNALISAPLHLPAQSSPPAQGYGSTVNFNAGKAYRDRASPGNSSATLTQDTFLLPQRDAPATPAEIASHRRQSSGGLPTGSPNTRRHLASKSLESSPLLPGFGSPGMTLESEFASALSFGGPPTGLGLSPQTSGFQNAGGLERSNTLSKFANKVLHRKSMSGGALPKSPARNAARGPTPPEGSREAALEQELLAERRRNAEIEQTLAQYKEAHEVSRDIALRKQSLAALDAQIVQVEAKNDALLQQQYKLTDRSIPLSEWRQSIVADVNSSIRHTRDETNAEIEALIKERNELRRENEAIAKLKQQQEIEMATLQQSHQDLQAMNEKLLKQIQSNMASNKTNSSQSPPPPQQSEMRARNDSEGTLGSVRYGNTAFGIPPSISENSFLTMNRQPVYQPSSQDASATQSAAQFGYPPRPLEHTDSLDTVATFSSELDNKLYGSATQSSSNLGLGLSSETTLQSGALLSERRDSIIAEGEEEAAVVEKVINRLSGEHTELAPKKFKWKKGGLSKTFRWGGKNGSTAGVPGDLTTSIISQPYESTASIGMTTSRSSDKLSMYSSRTGSSNTSMGGKFKRTWASHNNLASQLRSGSPQDSEVAYYGTSASNGSLSTLAAGASAAGLFGTDLVVRSQLEKRLIPGIITSCVHFLESHALEHEGLYRKSGGAGAMKLLVEAFEQSSSEVIGTQAPVSVDFERFDDINAITSVLKQYLRKLPVPLIRFEAYEGFLGTSAIPDPDIRIRAVVDVLKDLPAPHFETIRFLFQHLQKVTTYAKSNLMTSRNLAVVLGPTVIWDLSGEKEMNDMQAKNQSIQFLIEQAHRL